MVTTIRVTAHFANGSQQAGSGYVTEEHNGHLAIGFTGHTATSLGTRTSDSVQVSSDSTGQIEATTNNPFTDGEQAEFLTVEFISEDGLVEEYRVNPDQFAISEDSEQDMGVAVLEVSDRIANRVDPPGLGGAIDTTGEFTAGADFGRVGEGQINNPSVTANGLVNYNEENSLAELQFTQAAEQRIIANAPEDQDGAKIEVNAGDSGTAVSQTDKNGVNRIVGHIVLGENDDGNINKSIFVQMFTQDYLEGYNKLLDQIGEGPNGNKAIARIADDMLANNAEEHQAVTVAEQTEEETNEETNAVTAQASTSDNTGEFSIASSPSTEVNKIIGGLGKPNFEVTA